jgi:hypothetical protein
MHGERTQFDNLERTRHSGEDASGRDRSSREAQEEEQVMYDAHGAAGMPPLDRFSPCACGCHVRPIKAAA